MLGKRKQRVKRHHAEHTIKKNTQLRVGNGPKVHVRGVVIEFELLTGGFYIIFNEDEFSVQYYSNYGR